MPVQDTSLEALKNYAEGLGHDEQLVFEAICELGPTHDRRILEYLNQKERFKPKRQRRKWEINSVTGRRNALVNKYAVIEDLGPYKGSWCGKPKTYHFWRAIGDEREPVGWTATENLEDGTPYEITNVSHGVKVPLTSEESKANNEAFIAGLLFE